MKKIILCISIATFVLGTARMHTITFKNASNDKDVSISVIIQTDELIDLNSRKISASTLLSGLANSCVQLGKLAKAKDEKEKQEETCNLIASVLQLAADGAKEREESKKNNHNNTDNPETKENQNEEALDKTTNLVLKLINFIENDMENQLKSETTPYLSMLSNIKDEETKREVIEQLLNDKNESESFMQEIITTIKKFMTISLPEFVNEVVNSIKFYFNLSSTL